MEIVYKGQNLILPMLGILAAAPLSFAANILIAQVGPGVSHAQFISPLVGELAIRGHNVTYFTTVLYNETVPNLTQIYMPLDVPLDFLKVRRMFSSFGFLLFSPIPYSKLTEFLLTHEKFQELISNEGNSFDVVIVETMWIAIAGALSQRFMAPLIIISPVQTFSATNMLVGNLAHFSFIPSLLSNLPQKMTFWQRAQNFIFINLSYATITLYVDLQDSLMKKFVKADLPNLGDILTNTSLVFINDFSGISYPKPMVPNMIPIGGIHVKPPKPLPTDLQKIMDASRNGVIFFSLGANFLSSNMDDAEIDMIMKTFTKLKETVIWKFENNQSFYEMPKNVVTKAWLPQADILAHPNLKLFITHGGLLSTIESVARGVPIIGIPLMFDQPGNVKQSTTAGVGLSLDLESLTTETFYNTIREVIDNPKYKEAALARSRRFNDRPMSPMDTAVYWVEYVIRHKGAPHLRSASLDLTWYQLYQVDVVAMLTVIALFTFFASLLIVKKVLSVLLRAIMGRIRQTAPKIKKTN